MDDAQETQTEVEKPRETAEKPKKTLTPAQLKNLERMRLKKLAKSEAKKMISAETQARRSEVVAPPDVPAPKPAPDIPEDVRRALLDISDYINEKRERKKQQNVADVQMYPQWRICRG